MIFNNKSRREKQTRYLSQAIQLEEAVNPQIMRVTMTIVSMALMTFIVWAGFTNINEVARTPGEIVPRGHQQIVQHLEGGLVKEIFVQDSEIVDKGKILVTLDDKSLKKDIERLNTKQIFLKQQIERFRAYIEKREPNFSDTGIQNDAALNDQYAFFESMKDAKEKEERIIRKQIDQKKQSIRSLKTDLATAQRNFSIARDVYQRRSELNKKGYASDMQLLEDERNVNQIRGDIDRLNNQILVSNTEISEFEGRLESLSARNINEINEKLDQIMAEEAQNKELMAKLTEQFERMHIKAPVRGLVKGLAVNTIGGVIQPGQTIMEIVPLNHQLEASVKISPQDIGHLKVGQSVQLKFSTFDFSRYGSMEGKLEQISPTTFAAEDGSRYYRGRVSLDKAFVGSNPNNIVLPGMTVMADIITGEKSILQYMLKPIHISLKTAFTER